MFSGYRRRGPVLGLGQFVYLLGPEANRFIFANSELFRWLTTPGVWDRAAAEVRDVLGDRRPGKDDGASARNSRPRN